LLALQAVIHHCAEAAHFVVGVAGQTPFALEDLIEATLPAAS